MQRLIVEDQQSVNIKNPKIVSFSKLGTTDTMTESEGNLTAVIKTGLEEKSPNGDTCSNGNPVGFHPTSKCITSTLRASRLVCIISQHKSFLHF